MSIKGSDPILGPSRGDPAAFLAVFNQPDAKDREYVAAVATWAPKATVDSALVYDQFCQETTEPSIKPLSPGTSTRWNNDKNPAGIGIPLDSTNQPVKINSGDEAARIHIQCLYSLVKRELHPDVPLPPAWIPWFNTVWLPKVQDKRAPKVSTLADLNIRYVGSDGESRATWAWDAQYLVGLIAYATKWLPNVPDVAGAKPVPTPQKLGHVPLPPMVEHYVRGIPNQNSYAQMQTRVGNIHGSCTHTPEGYLGKPTNPANYDDAWTGTVGYFDHDPNCKGLTDAVIGHAVDGPEWDGVIVRVIDPASGLTPYANGVVDEATPHYGDAIPFIQKYGIEPAVNAFLRSVELSDGGNGEIARDLKSRQIESYCFLVAYWHFNEAGQDPGLSGLAGLLNRIFHAEFGGDHQQCPGSAMWALAQATFERIVEIGRAYLYGTALSYPLLITYPPNWTGPKVPTPEEMWAAMSPKPDPAPTPKPTPQPTYAAPSLPGWWEAQKKLVFPTDQSNGWIACRRKWTTTAVVKQGSVASAKSPRAGADIPKGVELFGERITKSADGQEYAIVRANAYAAEGARIPLSALKVPPGFTSK